MKHWIGLMMIAFTLGYVADAQSTTTVTLPTLTLTVGEASEIAAQIDCQADACTAFALTIQYDPTLLRVDQARVGPYLGDQVFVVENRIDPFSGTVQLDAATLGVPATMSDTPLLYLDVVALKTGTSALAITELRVADEVGNRLEAIGIAGGITILSTRTATSTATPTISATDYELTVQAEINQLLTEVEVTRRALITSTPTPDTLATASTRLTQTSEARPVSTPTRTPTLAQTPTIRPTTTRSPTNTPRATITPTYTRTQRPTATQQPSATPQPLSTIVPGGVEVAFSDAFDSNALSWAFDVLESGQRPTVSNGLLTLNASDSRSDFIGRSRVIEDNGGVLVRFRLEGEALQDEILLFLFSQNREWYFHSQRVISTLDGNHIVQGGNENRLKANTWYYLMHHVGEGGRFTTFIWEQDQSIFQPVLSVSAALGDDWNGRRWSTRLHVTRGVVSVDLYEELRFPPDYFACTVSASGIVNRRDVPAVAGGVVGELRGRYLPVLARAEGTDGFTWWQLTDESWVRNDVIVVTGDCDRVPTLPSPGWPGGAPITANDQWQPVVQRFDGVDMVLVPAGSFVMGGTPEQIQAALARCVANLGAASCSQEFFEYAGPPRQITFNTPFWIDRYEVTNQQFAAFEGQAARTGHFSGATQPRETITWFEARDFCALRGARLPTEAEWEYAARGPDSLVYPWGNQWNENAVVWGGNSNSHTASVGSRSGDTSWVGALDMGGNVAEWTNSLYEPYPYRASDGRERDTGSSTTVVRDYRGGAWVNDPGDRFRAWIRLDAGPAYSGFELGFRCARSF